MQLKLAQLAATDAVNKTGGVAHPFITATIKVLCALIKDSSYLLCFSFTASPLGFPQCSPKRGELPFLLQHQDARLFKFLSPRASCG